ncbi:MAG: CRISPR-associated endonuclease Cas1 [Acidimicrobiia bacterium]|nr:CRISPR-associated endonuclease Cas1 [Acidimicrobiia bacterium]
MSELGHTTLPGLVPARMVNEFTYCPRLFHLEWVTAQFADNTDTVEGRWVHRVVDSPGGSAPRADEEDVLRSARSVMLSSERLGLVAKADLLEGDGTVVTPVDYKRGRPPDNPERAWEPERVQLCVIGLLLRDNGYTTDKGVLYFAETRERVEVAFDEILVERTLEVVDELRQVAARETSPPPLVDSPKCPRCSLVGICLPDETNTLAIRQATPPRRLIPRNQDPRPLYVSEQGAWLSKKKGRIEITKNKEPIGSVRALDVSQVCVYGNVQISTQLLRELFAREVPVCWFSYGGWFAGMAEGLPSKHVELRRRQVALAHQGSLEIARRMVDGKIRNSRTLLRRNSRTKPTEALAQLKALAEKTAAVDSIDSLLGVEGAAARTYFQGFSGMLRLEVTLPGEPFSFDGRKRRPPPDPVNCLLGYLYGLLTKDLTVTAHAVGLDPYLGFYHRPRFGRPALALDLAEEFRPLVAESTALTLINNGEVRESDFVVRAGGVALTSPGRKKVLGAYERRLDTEVTHPTFGYKCSYRRVLEVQVRILGGHLLGEVPHYVPFTTR